MGYSRVSRRGLGMSFADKEIMPMWVGGSGSAEPDHQRTSRHFHSSSCRQGSNVHSKRHITEVCAVMYQMTGTISPWRAVSLVLAHVAALIGIAAIDRWLDVWGKLRKQIYRRELSTVMDDWRTPIFPPTYTQLQPVEVTSNNRSYI